MPNSVLDPIKQPSDYSYYMISVQEVIQAPVKVPKNYTNSEALTVVASYLDKTTNFLRQRRLASS